jgi:hypothetical protein
VEQRRDSPETKQQKETERGGWGKEKEEEKERERKNQKEKQSQKEKGGARESHRQTTRAPVRSGDGVDSRSGSGG